MIMNENTKERLIRVLNIAIWVALIFSIVFFAISLRSPDAFFYVMIALGFWIVVIGLRLLRQKLQGKKLRL